jgi:GNAT superfamily N-acetyltransferase
VTITIRRAVDADLPVLLALYAELHPDDVPPPPEAAAKIWRQIEEQSGRSVLVAMLGGVGLDEIVAGTADCTVLPNLTRGGRPFMLVENVVVAQVYRRLGVGRALLAAAVTDANGAGCYKVQLLSRDTRSAAHAFYEALGFRAVAQGYRRYLS